MADDEEAEAQVELQPKRTTSFLKRNKLGKKKKAAADSAEDQVISVSVSSSGLKSGNEWTDFQVCSAEYTQQIVNDLAAKFKQERQRTMYWARLLLIFPLLPVMVALTTIVFGGIVINAATNQCGSGVLQFLQGAVVLSYVLVLFYAYCWLGPKPIKSLRTLQFFYGIYGLMCIAWWGLYGSYQASTATRTGFRSCYSLSPSIYVMVQYEVAIFWIVFVLAIGFVVNEKTSKWRQQELLKLKLRRQKLALDRAKQKARVDEQQALEKQQKQLQEQQQQVKEQEKFYAEDEEDPAHAKSPQDPEAAKAAAEEADEYAEFANQLEADAEGEAEEVDPNAEEAELDAAEEDLEQDALHEGKEVEDATGAADVV